MMSKHSPLTTTTTPPDNFVYLPLTPPSTVDKPTQPSDRISPIIRHLKLRKAGLNPSDKSEIIFQLGSGDFEQLLAVIKADDSLWGFFEDKVRYDYFSRSNYLVFRMPTSTHEFFQSSIEFEIQQQLVRIASGTGVAAEFAQKVRYRGSPRLRFPADEVTQGNNDCRDRDKTVSYDAHEPDITFQHEDAQWPAVVVEIAFPQEERELRALAEDYILGSDGNIRVVVGLKIQYQQSKKATLSVWRPRLVKAEDGAEDLLSMQDVFEEEFRNDAGNLPLASTSTGLSLHLADFASPALISNPSALTDHIFISPTTLYELLTKAEADEQQVKDKTGKMMMLEPGVRKRKQERTSLDELKDEDERKWTKSEELAKKVAKADKFSGGREG